MVPVPGIPESCGGMKSVSIAAPAETKYFRRQNLNLRTLLLGILL